jgi:hypothetical protein
MRVIVVIEGQKENKYISKKWKDLTQVIKKIYYESSF